MRTLLGLPRWEAQLSFQKGWAYASSQNVVARHDKTGIYFCDTAWLRLITEVYRCSGEGIPPEAVTACASTFEVEAEVEVSAMDAMHDAVRRLQYGTKICEVRQTDDPLQRTARAEGPTYEQALAIIQMFQSDPLPILVMGSRDVINCPPIRQPELVGALQERFGPKR